MEELGEDEQSDMEGNTAKEEVESVDEEEQLRAFTDQPDEEKEWKNRQRVMLIT